MSGECKVTVNTKITNYKPTNNRTPLSTDLNITNNSDNEISVPNHYVNLVNKLKGLDGNSDSLSPDDLSLAKKLSGQFGISQVLNDTNVVRFVFNDGTNFRIDMSVNDKSAIKTIQEQITMGNAYYDGGIINWIMQKIDNCTKLRKNIMGDEIVVSNLPDNIKTLAQARAYLNLPQGTLQNNATNGGDPGEASVECHSVRIHVGILAEKLGVTKEQIKALFNE
jgi:hypothetical protein